MLAMLLIPLAIVETAEQLAKQLSPESQGPTFTAPVGAAGELTHLGALPVITDVSRIDSVRAAVAQMPGCLLREVANPVDGETAWPAWLAELNLEVIYPPRN